mmetsp:Transcript_2302/g.5378  ORF Transcript_2302/g.5378 Transcript_2302/m.5378 type:complete len:110 (-) Transcript_2302:1906-2235(-)
MMSSAFVTVESLCAMMSTVLSLCRKILSKTFCTSYSLSASSADVASSRIRSVGERMRTRASATLCFCPPDKESLRTQVAYPSGNLDTNCAALASLAAFAMSSRLTQSEP